MKLQKRVRRASKVQTQPGNMKPWGDVSRLRLPVGGLPQHSPQPNTEPQVLKTGMGVRTEGWHRWERATHPYHKATRRLIPRLLCWGCTWNILAQTEGVLYWGRVEKTGDKMRASTQFSEPQDSNCSSSHCGRAGEVILAFESQHRRLKMTSILFYLKGKFKLVTIFRLGSFQGDRLQGFARRIKFLSPARCYRVNHLPKRLPSQLMGEKS